ncbi:MAG: c-type cytochrome [Persicimonas sp.]
MKDETIAKFLKVALVVGGVSALAPVVSAQGIGVAELDRMLIETPQKVERGEELYEENCAVCHGEDGQGKSGIRLADAGDRTFETTDFTEAEFDYGGGPIQLYNAITFGLDEAVVGEPEEVPPHPRFGHLQYQSRWDIVHYVRSLGPTEELSDPPELVDVARERAEKGVCDPEIRETINAKVTPQGEEQLAQGEELYASNCVSCHGEDGKGDGPAAGALEPAPRNFIDHGRDDWTNDPSPLGVFNALNNGVPGTSMASYSNLPEEDLWAMTHYVLGFVPDDVAVESSEEQILDACRSLSAPEPPTPVSVDVAMEAMIRDQVEERHIRLTQFGTVQLSPEADAQRGQAVYAQNCATCHGSAGSGRELGPYGAQPPFMYLQVSELVPAMAGGTAEQFAERSYAGAHATLPDMTSAAMLSESEWQDLQAYIATFDGRGEVTTAPQDRGEDGEEAEDGEESEDGEEAEEADEQQPAEGQESDEDTAEQPPAEDAPEGADSPAEDER